MNENGGIIDLSSDSDDDSIFGDDHQPASAITRFDQNEGRIINFEDEDWQRSAPAPSSVRPTENNNGQYRILPASITNGRNAESSRYTVGSGDRIRPYPSSHMAMRQGLSTSSRIDSSSTADANDNNKSVLPPSFSNGNALKSMHPIAASETRKLPPHFSTKRSPNVGENRMGTNVANGNLQPSSSIIARGSSSTLDTQKVDDDDDVVVYGGSTSHRVLPPMVGGTSSNNSEVANGFETRNRLNPENRVLDHDERAVYQEALQNISREKREDDLPEGVLAVPLLKHQKMALAWMVSKENSSHCAGGILADDQGLGKTVSTIALIQKQRNEQSKFMSVDSDRLKSEALNLDEDDEGEQTVSNEPNKDQGASSSSTATGTSAELCVNQPNNVLNKMVETKAERKKKAKASTSSASTSRSMTRPAAGTLVVCPASVLKQWANELTDKVSEGAKLSVLVYHGGARTKDPSELAKYDVVVTTYTIVFHFVFFIVMDGGSPSRHKKKRSKKNQDRAAVPKPSGRTKVAYPHAGAGGPHATTGGSHAACRCDDQGSSIVAPPAPTFVGDVLIIDAEEEALERADRTIAATPTHTSTCSMGFISALVPFLGISPIMWEPAMALNPAGG
ncbi:helicase-like transcription factor CHR27 [Miscanthus floridulus]|uniref:helicase-like transcription factor CHR27 n=1 Tax=Miscanthus floridulus TaxID=154761 RepID=UPI00345A212A